MTGNEIRQQFLDFFASKGHRIVKSSPLLPANDPTLLFTNAGMNQFKDVFLGQEKRDYSRATSSQKCVRAGGKHNDLENVGYTRRHHTFFEMLGNFSFGDYFKADAIRFAWELITEVYKLPKENLYITVFREDDEAEELWQQIAGVSKDHIFRLDEKDNFWQMGETGPCGPCSEIHYDLGPEAAEPGREHEQFPLDGGGRFVEFWNLVFMQFNKDASGLMTPLPRPSVDTGMGLERITAILQGKLSNYETDLIAPIMLQAASLLGVTFGTDPKIDTTLRIVADHARATAFLIHDGVLPANDGRGYVLRKIMRRAMRHAHLIGREEPFLYQLTGFVAEFMQQAYPEMLESISRVARIVKDEEYRYQNTFLVAEKQFHAEVAALVPGEPLPGAISFKLYDTFGLATDEQEEMARELGVTIDREGFDQAMRGQKEKARSSWKGAEKGAVVPAYQDLLAKGKTRFLGYSELVSTSRVTGLLIKQQPVTEVPTGTDAELVLDQTPFYAETGGQVGDHGTLYSASTGEAVAKVTTAFPGIPGLTIHRIHTLQPLRVGDQLKAEVSTELRHATMRNHTATHLLHAALRNVLGSHVKQAGSVVEPPRLRFDFTHYAALSAEELRDIERIVNAEILRNQGVTTNILPIEEALATGAMALFGEKYGDEVRVVTVAGEDGTTFSRELCGGTHVGRSGDIGVFKISSEGSISAGVRRIEAITGTEAVRQYQQTSDAMHRVAQLVRANDGELVEQVERVISQNRQLERQVEQLKTKLAHAASAGLEAQSHSVNGARVLLARVDGMDRQQMRTLADSLRNKWKSAVIVLAGAEEGTVSVVSAVTKDLTGKVQAGKLAAAVSLAIGGKGGGRPDMAEGGGKDVTKLDEALATTKATIEAAL
jgi:alanyl-tRNA synthetase